MIVIIYFENLDFIEREMMGFFDIVGENYLRVREILYMYI